LHTLGLGQLETSSINAATLDLLPYTLDAPRTNGSSPS
jgi:hypothetical protein